jgi:hypothetical protein
MEIGPHETVPTKLLAVARRFRESNLSCDHLRECLNELLGVGPETTSLRGLLSARHLVWECGPNRNKRRTETTTGRREAGPLSREEEEEEDEEDEEDEEEARRAESTYLPVGLLLNPRSRLMDSSSPGPMHAYLRHESAGTCTLPLSSPSHVVARARAQCVPIDIQQGRQRRRRRR